MIFDTHLHLSPETDLPAAIAAGVGKFLLNASSYDDTLVCREYASKFPTCFFTAGVHPHECEKETHSASDFLGFAAEPKLAAVGEIGLDTFYDFAGFDRQLQTFESMLELAEKLQLPAVVHCRSAENDDTPYAAAYERLAAFARRGGTFELHCYAGTREWLEKFADLGSYFGIGGMLTFKHSDNIRELARNMPIDRIVLETDAPYLAPVPFRGKPNVSAYLPPVARKLGELLGRSREEIEEITTRNANRLFPRSEHVR